MEQIKLRDYFAIRILQKIIELQLQNISAVDEIRMAYDLANKMIEIRAEYETAE